HDRTRRPTPDARRLPVAGADGRLPGRESPVPDAAYEGPMSAGDVSLMDLFREEVRTQSAMLSQGLLALESEPANAQPIEPLMRAAHSIKGAARIVNIDAAVRLAHGMEDAFVATQEGRITLTPDDVDQLLRGSDLLGELSNPSENPGDWSARHESDI